MPTEEVVNDISEGCGPCYCLPKIILESRGESLEGKGKCGDGNWGCPWRQALLESNIPNDVLVQARCTEIHKLNESEKAGEDVGKRVYLEWEGTHALTFRAVSL